MLDALFQPLVPAGASPGLFAAVAALLGLATGSFLNVVVHRLPPMLHGTAPTGHNLFSPRSACPACGHRLRLRENIPVLSYLALCGKCIACKAPISPRYPLLELLCGALFALASWRFGFSATLLAAWILVAALLALAAIDMEHQLLPDCITLPLLWSGLFLNLEHGFTDLQSAVLGAMAGYLVLWLVYWMFRLSTGKEGLGRGDFKLLAALGAWLGWQALPTILLLASLTGSLAGLTLLLLARHVRHAPLAFGPYLALGGLVALFWGPQLISWYFA